MKALIISVDQESITLLENTLKIWGYEIASVRSALEAFEVLKGEDFDVIILNLGKQASNGMNIIAKLKHLRRDIKIAVYSTKSLIGTDINYGKLTEIELDEQFEQYEAYRALTNWDGEPLA